MLAQTTEQYRIAYHNSIHNLQFLHDNTLNLILIP